MASDETMPHKRTVAPPSDRDSRAAAALRQNLRKRKEQQRQREAASDVDTPATKPKTPDGGPSDDDAG